jgi:hypothetical protein
MRHWALRAVTCSGCRIACHGFLDVLCHGQCGGSRGTASQSSLNLPPAPLTRRAGSVARSSIWPGPCTVGPLSVPPSRATVGHGPLGVPGAQCRPLMMPPQQMLGHWHSCGRPLRPLMMPPQPPPLRAALSPPLRRPGVPEMLGHGRGRVGRGGGSSQPTFGTPGTASASVPQIQAHLHLVV